MADIDKAKTYLPYSGNLSDDDLHVLTTQLMNGVVSTNDKELLKTEYFLRSGIPRKGCTTCSDFYNDVLTLFRIYFRLMGKEVSLMAKQPKYIFSDNGHFRLHGTGVTLVNPGTAKESDRIKWLTTGMAEELIKQHPDAYGRLLIDNPEYGKDSAVESTEPASGATNAKKTANGSAKKESVSKGAKSAKKQATEKPAKKTAEVKPVIQEKPELPTGGMVVEGATKTE